MEKIRSELREYSDEDRARVSASFFKTGKGEYGEGDVFLGVSVPNSRKVARGASERILLDGVGELLGSRIHEERLVGLLILVDKYEGGDGKMRKEIYDFYLANARGVNNWDLVDLSAPKIVGRWLENNGDRNILNELAVSDNLWERRIAIVATFAFIRRDELDDALRISEILLGDSEDLIHKAVGWMLREVGKKDADVLRSFLRENYDELPRTTLRYAIERFSAKERKGWLRGGGLHRNLTKSPKVIWVEETASFWNR